MNVLLEGFKKFTREIPEHILHNGSDQFYYAKILSYTVDSIKPAFQIQQNETVMYIRDTSLWNISDHGLVISDLGLRYIGTDDNSQLVFVRWNSIDKVEYDESKKEVNVFFVQGGKRYVVRIANNFFVKDSSLRHIMTKNLFAPLLQFMVMLAKSATERDAVQTMNNLTPPTFDAVFKTENSNPDKKDSGSSLLDFLVVGGAVLAAGAAVSGIKKMGASTNSNTNPSKPQGSRSGSQLVTCPVCQGRCSLPGMQALTYIRCVGCNGQGRIPAAQYNAAQMAGQQYGSMHLANLMSSGSGGSNRSSSSNNNKAHPTFRVMRQSCRA